MRGRYTNTELLRNWTNILSMLGRKLEVISKTIPTSLPYNYHHIPHLLQIQVNF